jgi:hypothetical protein
MRPWLRQNWIGLVAVAVLLPATVGVTFSTQWNAYFSGRPSQPTTVASGETVEFANAQWRVTGTRRISAATAEGAHMDLPAGSDLVVVTVRVSPDAGTEAPGCLVNLEEFDGSAVSRAWNDASTDPIDFRATEGTESYCPPDATGAYLLESVFVVASDARDDLGLAVTVAGELPRYLSLRL